MAYVPGYSADVFLSYAHRDDQDGWVTRLKGKLADRLTNDLAGEPEVWFDSDRLRTGDIFKEKIREKLSGTLMLIAIVSPSYLRSQFCMEEELNWFLDNFGREVFQLLKIPLEDGQDAPLPGADYEKLFDSQAGVALTGDSLDAELNKIVWTIRGKMENAKRTCRKIYLAQPKNDALRSVCLEVKKELHRKAYAVLPNEFVTLRTLDSKIRKWIEEAEISVHIAAGESDPLADRQFAIAREVGKPWVQVSRNQPAQDAVDQVKRTLANARRPEEVYFVYDYHSDQEHAGPLRSFLEQNTGRKVTIPQPGETYHKAKLQDSKGIVLFRRAAPESWFQAQKETLQQATALRRDRVVPEAWYSVRPGYPNQVRQSQEPPLRWLIERTGSPDVTDLLGFCAALGPQAPPDGAR